MTKIPDILNKNRFRFALIYNGSKFPFEKKWQKENNYPPYHSRLIEHLNNGGNYGVVCGYANLLVIDCDTKLISDLTEEKLPDTFKVETGSGGHHYYFICEDFDSSTRLKDDDGENIGDIQYKGKQVVGPNSSHPNGNKYEVVRNVSLARVSREEIIEVFDDMIISKSSSEKAKDEELGMKEKYNGGVSGLSVADVVSLKRLYKRDGLEYQGSHPVHGSSTGRNFGVNIKKNVWKCWRHGVGGGPYSLIAVKHGIIKCHEAGQGALDKKTFKKVLRIAKKKYGLRS